MKVSIATIIFLFLSTFVFAQEPNFSIIEVPDSIKSINDISKSSNGYIYIATNRGFYRYFSSIDAIESIYKSKDVGQLKINVIQENVDSGFYLGTYRSSVIFVDKNKEIVEYSFKDILHSEQLVSDINSIDNLLYIATSEGNIIIFDTEKKTFSSLESPVKSEINAIWKAKSGALWVSSIEGVFYKGEDDWQRLKGFLQAYGLKVKSGEYWVIGRDKEFNAKIKYLYNYETDVLKLNKQKWADLIFHNLPNNFLRFNDIDFDSQGMLWLASNIGVLKYDPFTGYSIWFSKEKYPHFELSEASHIQVVNDSEIVVSNHNIFYKITFPLN